MVEVPFDERSISIVATVVSDAPPLPEIPELQLAICASRKAEEVLVLVAENNAFDCALVAANLQSYPLGVLRPRVVQHKTVI